MWEDLYESCHVKAKKKQNKGLLLGICLYKARKLLNQIIKRRKKKLYTCAWSTVVLYIYAIYTLIGII